MKTSLDNIGYATVALVMLVLGVNAMTQPAQVELAQAPFGLDRVTVVAARPDAPLAANAAAAEPAERVTR